MIAGMPGRVRAAAEWGRRKEERKAWDGRQDRNTVRKPAGEQPYSHISGMDYAMLSYGACVVLSAACSSYGSLAWIGYEGWYMGAVSQLMFVGIYFFMSRQYNGEGWPLYLGEVAFFLVTLLGLLHRLGIDPLGLMAGWDNYDWEYSHMLSTLGNINWLCGYYSVALAFVIAHFFQAESKWLQAVLYVVSVAAFMLLLVQGSQSGLLILAACVVACFFLGRRRKVVWRKALLVLAGTFAAMPFLGILMELRGEKAAVVADGNIFDGIGLYSWLVAAFVCLFLFLILKDVPFGIPSYDGITGRPPGAVSRAEKDFRARHTLGQGGEEADRAGSSAKKGKGKVPAAVLLCVVGIAGLLAVFWIWRHMNDSFGSGRGFLWRISVEGFLQADGKDKLLGAGPDCYGEAVFNRFGAEAEVWKGEHWEGAVFTNAHNELLSQLCNVGILGTVSYLSIFIVGLHRYKSIFSVREGKNSCVSCAGDVGVLALSMYGIHSLVSFQQVLNAPLLFLVWGLCEAEKRRFGHRGTSMEQRQKQNRELTGREAEGRQSQAGKAESNGGNLR